MPRVGSLTSNGITIPLPSSLSVTSYGTSTALTIPGIDLAYAFAYSGTGASVTYQ